MRGHAAGTHVGADEAAGRCLQDGDDITVDAATRVMDVHISDQEMQVRGGRRCRAAASRQLLAAWFSKRPWRQLHEQHRAAAAAPSSRNPRGPPPPLQARKAAWQAPPLKATRGTLYKYIKNVKTASEGCVTDE